MKSPYFWCHRSEMWQDSFTYGDWRQYICNRPGGQTQCAKVSELIWIFAGLGLGILAGVGLSIYLSVSGGQPPRWWDVGLLTFVGVMNLYPLYRALGGVFLMKAVGPMNRGSRRILPWEEDR